MQRIRTMREDRAQSAFIAARTETRAAQAELETRQERTRQYESTREERRDKVYAQVMGHVVSRDELDMTRESVARIDEEGVLLKQDEQKAAQVVAEKQRAEDLKHTQYFVATKARIKIEEHRKLWEEVATREEERKADAEMEEFTGRKDHAA